MQFIQKKSLAGEVADAIRHSISSGALAVGTRLPAEPELMQKFGVGRSSVREAVKQLVQSGYVHVQQGSGTFVTSQTGNAVLGDKIENAGFSEVFEVRQLLELQIIKKAALNRDSGELRIMRKSLRDRKSAADAGDLKKCINADILFHTTIAESCGNSILTALYKTLSEHLSKFFFSVYKDTGSFIESQGLHEQLLSCIEEKNEEQALATAQKIIGTI